MKHYISDVIGDGIDLDISPFRPALIDIVSVDWFAMDGREDPNSTGLAMLVSCDPTLAQHILIIADGRVEYIGET